MGRDAGRTREDEEVQRERYQELLQELRTVIPGAQVLFAFLLTAPFSSRFPELDPFGKRIFTGALLASALAIIIFLTPAAYHRIHGRDGRRTRLRLGVALTVIGMAVLAAAVTASVFLVVRFVYEGASLAGVLAGLVAGTTIVLRYLLPLSARVRSG